MARPVTVVVIDTGSGYRYFCDAPYITRATDTPALQSFESRLVGQIRWSREVTVIVWGGGRATGGLGAIKLVAADGQLDSLRSLPLRGKRLWVYRGEQGWAWADFALHQSALVDRVEPNGLNETSIITADLLARMEEPLCTLYDSSDDVPDQIEGRSKPIAIGHPFSCPVVLVNEVDYEYDCHDGPAWHGVSVVRDQGYPITAGTGYRRAINAGRYGIEKLFRAVGRVVADVDGAYVDVTEIVGASLGDFGSGLTGWSSGTTGSGTLTPSSGTLVWARGEFTTGTANITAGALTVGKAYLFSVSVTARTSGSIQLVNGATVIGAMNAVKNYTFGFIATSTSWKVELPGSSGLASLTVDTLRLTEVRVISRLPDVIRYLAVTRGGLLEGDVDWDSVDDLDTECPWPLSYWADGSATIRNVLDQVLDSFCGCMYEDRLGRLAVGRLRRPGSLTPTATILQSRLDESASPSIKPDLAPGLSRTVAGARNWYRYGPGELADDASLDPLRPVLEADYRIRKTSATEVHPSLGGRVGNRVEPRSDVVGTAITTAGSGRPPSDVGIGTLLDDESDIQDLADHIAGLYPATEELPEFLEETLFMSPEELQTLEPFSDVVLQLDRFATDRPVVVYKIDSAVGDNRVTLGLWLGAPEEET